MLPNPLRYVSVQESATSFLNNTGCISLANSGNISTRNGYNVRLLDAEVVDYDVLRGWLNYCGIHHAKQCAITSIATLPSLQVIDCDLRAITDLPDGFEFLALSYVWGVPTRNFSADRSDPGSALSEEIPQVIRDAITVTKNLGFRYLWVDRYCISSNNTIKHEQIKNMDIVYRAAHATIIAVAGEDPTFGLPGVSSRARNAQPHARIGMKLLASTLPNPHVSIIRSKWASRAWTYQECLLSRRRVFFTSEQVYFECQSMHCCEAVSAPLDAIHTPSKERLRISITDGLYPLHGLGKSPQDIWTRITEYTRRSITYESDTLNGMLGLLRAFSERETPVYHLWGVP
ncbi:HET-domain-containing protein, partial [Zopfia rhizophila CBS 207.26]